MGGGWKRSHGRDEAPALCETEQVRRLLRRDVATAPVPDPTT